MPRRVVLMRHATAVARALVARGVRASRIVASPARRAVETAEAVAREMRAAAPSLDGRLYEADEEDLVRIAAELGAPDETLMLVGHNPGMADAVAVLGGPPAEWDGMGAFFPPASAAVFEAPNAGRPTDAVERLWLLRAQEL